MRLPRTSRNEIIQVFTPDPSLTTTITSPCTYNIPAGASCVMFRATADIAVQLNGSGSAMLFNGDTRESIGVYQGEGRASTALKSLVFGNTATVTIWAM